MDWDAIEGKNVYAKSKVNARIKELQADFEFPEDSFEAKILHASDLMSEEKTVKREAKDLAAALHQHTKETIEGLSDEQVLLLLEQKWIVPLVEQLYALPQAAVDGLVKKVSALAQKYAATLTDLDAEIARTEREFSVMLEQLTGSASDMEGLAELKKLLGGA